jgi:hypothetical protein
MSERQCAAPRAWLLRADIPHGPWRCLVYLWTWGPFWSSVDDPLPASGSVKVWPSKARIAADIGVSAATVHSWVMSLTQLGWIRRNEDHWVLAVSAPFQLAPSQLKPRGSRRARRVPTETVPTSAPVVTGTVSTETLGVVTGTVGGCTQDPHGVVTGTPDLVVILQSSSNDLAPASTVPDPDTPGPTTSPPKPRRKRAPARQASLPDIDRPPEIVAWWAKFNETRKAAFTRWHGSPSNDIRLTDERQRDLLALIDAAIPDKPLTEQLAAADHVMAVIVAWIDRDEGKLVPTRNGSDYDSMDRLGPAYWLQERHFTKALERERRSSSERVRPGYVDHRSRGSSMPGQNERLAEAADRDNAERERMEAELQAHLAKIRGPNYVPPPPRVDEDEECTF